MYSKFSIIMNGNIQAPNKLQFISIVYLHVLWTVLRLFQLTPWPDEVENLNIGSSLVRLLSKSQDLPTQYPKGPETERTTITTEVWWQTGRGFNLLLIHCAKLKNYKINIVLHYLYDTLWNLALSI